MTAGTPGVLRVAAAVTAVLVAGACSTESPSSHVPTPAPVPTASASASTPPDNEVVVEFDPAAQLYGGGGYLAALTRPAAGATVSVVDAATGSSISGGPHVVPLDTSCGLAVVSRPNRAPLVLGMERTSTPSRGVERGSSTQNLVGLDGATLTEEWTAPVVTEPDDGFADTPNTSCAGGRPGLDSAFRATSDGRAALVTYARPRVVVDLGTGAARPVPDAVAVLDRWLAVGRGSSPDKVDTPAAVDLIDPVTSTVAGTTADPAVVDPLIARTFGAADLHAAVASSAGVVVLDVAGPPGAAANDSGLAAFSLPGLQRLWKLDRPASAGVSVFVDGRGEAVTFDDSATPAFSAEAAAVSLTSGKPLWHVDGTAVCSAGGALVTVAANRQLAFLRSADGSQIDYDADQRECPDRVGDVLLLTEQGRATFRLVRVSGPV